MCLRAASLLELGSPVVSVPEVAVQVAAVFRLQMKTNGSVAVLAEEFVFPRVR